MPFDFINAAYSAFYARRPTPDARLGVENGQSGSKANTFSRTIIRYTLFAFVLGLAASPGVAATFNRNEAHIDWRTVETEHFRFHYAAKLEPVAGYIAGIAEGVAEEKLKRYHIRLPNKVEFLIREDIFSNGWANSLQNIMTVWVADWDFPIRSTHNWLKDVVTHEFSHLVSIQSGSKFASPIQGLVVGYQDYYNEPVQTSAATIIPFTQQPNWFAEGVAQYESELSGYDAWDSHRDMLLRTAALQNKLLGYDRMGTFAGTSLEYELGPYTQGFAFVRWLAARHGDPAVVKLWAENARLHRQTLSGSMERVLGKDGYGQWEDWKNAVTAQYADQVKALGPLRMGKKLTSEGFYNYYPRWDHQGENVFFISNRGRDDFKGALYLYKLGDTAKKEEDRLKMIAPVRSPFDVAADDSTILYHSAKNEDKDGMSKLDIYQRNARRKGGFFEFGPDPTERRYTKDQNAVQASYDKEGKRIVFVRNRMANFQLCVAPVPDAPKARGKGRADVDSDEVKVLFPPDSMLENRFGFNIYAPRFSPDGKAILFSFYDATSRNIGIINSDGTGFRRLLDRPYDERDPEWAPDGKSIFFSADSNAIYNIYRVDIGRDSAGGFAAGTPVALTQVSGGAFSPAVDPTGKRLAYVNYDTTGFSLYLLTDLAPSGAPPTALRTLHPEDGAIEPLAFEGRSEKYVGIPNRYLLNPLLIGEEMSSRDRTARKGETKWLAGFNGLLNDPVDRNEVSAALLLEVGNGLDYFGANDEILSPDKESQFYLGWVNRSTPVTLDLAFARGNLTSHDTVTVRDKLGEAPESRENTDYAITFRNVEAGLSYNLFDAGAVEDEYHTSFVRVAGGYGWNDFNFYTGTYPFAFEYYNNLYLSAMANFYGATYSDKELIAPQGLAAAVAYSYDKSGIVRRGSFWDVFEVSPEGAVFTKFRDYTLNNLDAGVTYGLGLPWSDNGSVVASGFVGSLLSWEVANPDSGADTLDTFFSKGLFLRGYPFLRDIENLAFQGENTLKVSADLNQPILPDIYKAYWVLFVEDVYFNLFWEAGRAWTGPLWETGIFDKEAWGSGSDGWFQSAGWGLKLNARIYHNYPFLAYFEAATALSGVPDGSGNLQSLETVKIPIGGRGTEIDTYATRISFGVSFGFYNGLLGGTPAKAVRNPYRPESPLARR